MDLAHRVATAIGGNQGFDPVDMLRAILDASIHWLSTGLPLAVMKIVIYEREPDELIARAQETFRWYADNMDVQRSQDDNWDVFVSYSHVDANVVGNLVDRMKKLDPTIRVFHDRSELAAGNAWQHRIFAAIDASRKVVCLFSPEYLKSDVCLEEYNIAHLRNREEGEILIPAYLRSTALPSICASSSTSTSGSATRTGWMTLRTDWSGSPEAQSHWRRRTCGRIAGTDPCHRRRRSRG